MIYGTMVMGNFVPPRDLLDGIASTYDTATDTQPRHPNSENAAARNLCRMWIGVGSSERRLLLSEEAYEALC